MSRLETLPPDVRIDILSRLDAATLNRFRCVSRWCSSVVSDPEFLAAHHRRSRRNPLVLLAMNGYLTGQFSGARFYARNISSSSSSPFSLIREVSFPVSVLVPSRLELVCFLGGGEIHILNPTTKHLLTLPRPRLLGSFARTLAFAYVPSTEQYKVLLVTGQCANNRKPVLTAQVYALRTLRNPNAGQAVVAERECWREVRAPPFLIERDWALVNGALHFRRWLYPQYVPTAVPDIVRFDLEREEWSVLPIPSIAPRSSYCRLAELGGRLCIVDYEDSTEDVDVWMQKNYGVNVWVKEYSIDVSSLGPGMLHKSFPLAVEGDGRVLMEVDNGRLVLYNPTSGGSFEDVDIRRKISVEDGGKLCFQTTFYLESFLRLYG